MQSVIILRALWRHRRSVVLAGVLALFCGWALTYQVSAPTKRRSYDVGVANANVLVDTPTSQVVEVAPEGSDDLGTRANVLANLMVDGAIKSVIARRANLAPAKLIAWSDAGDGAAAPPLNATSYAYSTSVALTSDSTSLPIIKIQAQAPTVGSALKLADHVVAGLTEYLDSKAADESIADGRRLRVRSMGPAQGQEAVRGPRRMLGVLAAMLVFGLGCALILAVSGLARGWRAAVAEESDIFVVEESGDDDPSLAAWSVPGPRRASGSRAS